MFCDTNTQACRRQEGSIFNHAERKPVRHCFQRVQFIQELRIQARLQGNNQVQVRYYGGHKSREVENSFSKINSSGGNLSAPHSGRLRPCSLSTMATNLAQGGWC